jgi:hypothetical protein
VRPCLRAHLPRQKIKTITKKRHSTGKLTFFVAKLRNKFQDIKVLSLLLLSTMYTRVCPLRVHSEKQSPENAWSECKALQNCRHWGSKGPTEGAGGSEKEQ